MRYAQLLIKVRPTVFTEESPVTQRRPSRLTVLPRTMS